MKEVEVYFRITQEGIVRIKVPDNYDESLLKEVAQEEYDERDLSIINNFEIVTYDELHKSRVEAANEKETERIIDEEEDPWSFLGTIKM